MLKSITLAQLRAANILRQKEWIPVGTDLGPLFKAIELGGEIGEAQNCVKKLEREKLGVAGSRTTLDKLAEELADGLLCIDLLAEYYGIDLDAALMTKFNRTSAENNLKTLIHRLPGGEECGVEEGQYYTWIGDPTSNIFKRGEEYEVGPVDLLNDCIKVQDEWTKKGETGWHHWTVEGFEANFARVR